MPANTNLPPRVLSDAAKALQSDVLELARSAAAGSEMRRALCEAASYFPRPDTDFAPETDPSGGIRRAQIIGVLRQINAAREDGGETARDLRILRNCIERALHIFDVAQE